MKGKIWITLKPNISKRFLRDIFSSTEVLEKLNEWTEMKRHKSIKKGRPLFLQHKALPLQKLQYFPRSLHKKQQTEIFCILYQIRTFRGSSKLFPLSRGLWKRSSKKKNPCKYYGEFVGHFSRIIVVQPSTIIQYKRCCVKRRLVRYKGFMLQENLY